MQGLQVYAGVNIETHVSIKQNKTSIGVLVDADVLTLLGAHRHYNFLSTDTKCGAC